jgi:hypothetical protein
VLDGVRVALEFFNICKLFARRTATIRTLGIAWGIQCGITFWLCRKSVRQEQTTAT